MTKDIYIQSLAECKTEQELRDVLSLARADNEVEVDEFKDLCVKYIETDLSNK